MWALVSGLGLAAAAAAGEAPAPQRLSAANWTKHRKLAGDQPSPPAEAPASGKSRLVWRSLATSPAAVVSDHEGSRQASAAPLAAAKPAASRAGGATRLRVSVRDPRERASAAGPRGRRSAVVPAGHEQSSASEPVLQLAQQDPFAEPEDFEDAPDLNQPAPEPAEMPEEEPGDEPAAEPSAPESPAPATAPPPRLETYVPPAAAQPPAEDRFPTFTPPPDLCADGGLGCRREFEILKDDTLEKIGPGIGLSGAEGVNFPCICKLGEEEYAGRAWGETCFEWKASALCHKPLYFEEVALERYGHACVLQPAVSAARFFATVPILPYEMGMRPPWECVYPLGHYRPGSCAPYYIPPVPVSLRGGLLEAGVVTGLVYIIP